MSDRLGYYKTIMLSLILTGINFLWVMHVETFWPLCISFFLLIAMADIGRPAIFVALSAYSKPENKTRSLTLIRLAINLGFSVGPAVGGFLIANVGYDALFYVDGLSCLLAAGVMFMVLNPKKARELDREIPIKHPLPPWKDVPYLLFLLALALFAIVFVQYFSTVPLFYKKIYALSEDEIGLILAMNGALIFLLEMPLINWLQRLKYSNIQYTIVGLLMTGVSFLLLLGKSWVSILVLGMIIVTVGEMISFPFSNKFALDRSRKGRQGSYMGLYSMSFSIAHILGHNAGMQVTSYFGFDSTWLGLFGLSVLAWVLLLIVNRLVKKEQAEDAVSLATNR